LGTIGDTGDDFLRSRLSEFGVFAAEPELVGVAEGNSGGVHSSGQGVQLDCDAGAGHCFSAREAADMAEYEGRVIAFEPDPELLSQYFFVEKEDFAAAGLAPEVADAIAGRLVQNSGACQVCGHAATWLWFSREQVASLDEVTQIADAPGEWFCAKHGAEKLFWAFEKMAEANIFYMNLPYGESGAYVWI
jgi:hypothetical protein